MAASTVTGRGPGMSNGVYKPKNQCGGCNCGCGEEEETSIPTPSVGCYTKEVVGGKTTLKAGGGNAKIKVCS